MRVVPETNTGRLNFYATRLAPWAAGAGEIGLTADSVNHLAELTEAARAAHKAHLAAQNAARSAALAFRLAVREMHASPGAGSDMVTAIRNYAESTDDPDVYAKAYIPPADTSAQPGSAPAPGKPYDIRAVVEQAGTVQLNWKCRNPTGTRGTIYLIERQVGGSGPFTPLGAVGKRRFVDETLPRGACVGGGGGGGGGVSGVDGVVTYRITAQRSTKRGSPAVYTMRFGGFDSGVKKGKATALAA